MCMERFSRAQVHDLELELTLGVICQDVINTYVSKHIRKHNLKSH